MASIHREKGQRQAGLWSGASQQLLPSASLSPHGNLYPEDRLRSRVDIVITSEETPIWKRKDTCPVLVGASESQTQRCVYGVSICLPGPLDFKGALLADKMPCLQNRAAEAPCEPQAFPAVMGWEASPGQCWEALGSKDPN